jgi:hypothetical protein
LSEPEPYTITEFDGRVRDLFAPALATGAIFDVVVPAFTIRLMLSYPVAPLLSVTVSLKRYLPSFKLLTVTAEVLALVSVAAVP